MLQMDGRRPYADIANELGLAASTVQQRANALIDSGLIKIRAVTDPVALGVPVTATIALKIEGTRITEVADILAEFEEVGWLVICTGSFDLFIEIACRDNGHLLDFISNKLSLIEGIRTTETFIYLAIVKNTFQWGVP